MGFPIMNQQTISFDKVIFYTKIYFKLFQRHNLEYPESILKLSDYSQLQLQNNVNILFGLNIT